MSVDQTTAEQIKKLEDKYEAMGQDIHSYLDGLQLSNYLTYWDYIHLDTLLTLQNPKTDFPDEMIFIVYHQITELYFKLTRHELVQVAKNGKEILDSGEDKGWKQELEPALFLDRLRRCNAYFEALTKSFGIMVDGMEPEQFRRFRMALLPASGFQTVNYRKIEIMCTDLANLMHIDVREDLEKKDLTLEEQFENIYWKHGATELATGKKTLTLKQFEDKYTNELLQLAHDFEDSNMNAKWRALPEEARNNPELIQQMRTLDANVNINWPLVHYKSAVRYLHSSEEDAAATGGTNWQRYLPPRFQKRIFFPDLWSDEEKENWGKTWVENTLREI